MKEFGLTLQPRKVKPKSETIRPLDQMGANEEDKVQSIRWNRQYTFLTIQMAFKPSTSALSGVGTQISNRCCSFQGLSSCHPGERRILTSRWLPSAP